MSTETQMTGCVSTKLKVHTIKCKKWRNIFKKVCKYQTDKTLKRTYQKIFSANFPFLAI